MNCIVRAWERHESELRGYIRKQVGDGDAGSRCC